LICEDCKKNKQACLELISPQEGGDYYYTHAITPHGYLVLEGQLVLMTKALFS